MRTAGGRGRLVLVLVLVLGVGTLAPAQVAAAAEPALLGVGQEHRHPTADFHAPGADHATISFATKPDRATDGQFLEENVEHVDLFTADEIKAGRWTDSSQLDPGRYYVLLRATDADCLGDPGCLDGFSAMLTLIVPEPARRFRGHVTSYRFVSTIELSLEVRPLGRGLPYRVCWTRSTGRRACVRATVRGFSWNEPASDTISVRKRGMRRTTTFTWFVDGRKVASRRARIRR